LWSYGRWKFSGGRVVLDLRLQEFAAMLAVEAGGKKGGADLGGADDEEEDDGTDVGLTTVERVEESTIKDGWTFDTILSYVSSVQ